jgi:hypothetical protein
MKQISFAVVAALALAASGCKQTGGAGEAIATLAELKDRMCRCTDKPCSDKVIDDMIQWGQATAKAAGDHEPARSEEDRRRLQALTEALIACEKQALASVTSVTPVTGAAGGPADAGGGSAAAGAADVITGTH